MRRCKPIEERFWPKVDRDGGCWIWTGAQANGYGRIGAGRRGVAPLLAHRVAYELANGPIPPGLTIDHLCRNTLCVRPDHLEAVPIGVNVLRGEAFSAVNARKTHCPQGHEYTPGNTFKDGGARKCRICASRRAVEHKRRKRARATIG